jgi:hypothetical protein
MEKQRSSSTSILSRKRTRTETPPPSLDHPTRTQDDISFISDDIIDYIIIPMVDLKVLHYLKCTNSEWRQRIQRYLEKLVPDFEFVTNFGSMGSENGQFDYPEFVATDSRGNIYVSEYSNNRIQKFDPNGQWTMHIGSKGPKIHLKFLTGQSSKHCQNLLWTQYLHLMPHTRFSLLLIHTYIYI